MGKAKKLKKKKEQNPTGLMSVKDAEAEAEVEEMNTVDRNHHAIGTIGAIIEKLQCGSAEAKECACTTVASLVSQKESIQLLTSNSVLRIIGPLLIDDSLQVRMSAAGALRNVSAYGGADVCEDMVKQDVLTPLIALFKKQYSNSWMPEKVKQPLGGKEVLDVNTETFTHAVHLLWNLCENSSAAIRVFNKENILHILTPALQFDTYGIDAAISVARCLHAISEDNPEFVSAAASTDLSDTLTKLVISDKSDAEHLLLRSLAIGIHLNMADGKLESKTVMPIITVLCSCFRLDSTMQLTMLAAKLEETSAELGASSGSAEFHSSELDATVKTIENILDAQQTALEITTNICCTDDCEEEEWEDLDSSDTSESIADMEVEEQVTDSCIGDMVPDLHEAINSQALLQKVIILMKDLDTVTREKLSCHSQGNKLISSQQRVRCRALLCISNMVAKLSPDDVGGHDGLWELWTMIGTEAFQVAKIGDLELLESSTSAMRAVLQQLCELKSPKFKDMLPSNLQLLSEVGQHCEEPAVRANIVRILKTLGCFLAADVSSMEALKGIGLFLVEMCSRDATLWVCAESLDAIFDLFGQDGAIIEEVCRAIGLVDKLKTLSPVFRSKIQQQKKSLGENLAIILTAKNNLTRFIRYKESQYS